MEATLFYILAAVLLTGTLLAITARQAVRSIVYLVASFLALALMFYLLGAPLIAAFEVIIYAGAIMVLFLFVIMMLELESPEKLPKPHLKNWLPALLLAGAVVGSLVVLLCSRLQAVPPGFVQIPVRQFAFTLFKQYGVAVEVVSMQLLFALVGALYLGRRK
ncbi:NADH-quinone oxidoreductase subunit J [Geomonas oryzisoli]|uniref:NADH-quinone oxidoreductase subunit J n=1 Tax=Geomonas oryzisoli TaxID=2847992 RepID=A0ABX8J4X7_9BACT|nr:NADH-quinone oxidoreductase subunit J [Geomonas oryzisoli]QWV93505.1 NADH-quinone oxidoreductase subunit J [Geomonas oryzisoli]